MDKSPKAIGPNQTSPAQVLHNSLHRGWEKQDNEQIAWIGWIRSPRSEEERMIDRPAKRGATSTRRQFFHISETECGMGWATDISPTDQLLHFARLDSCKAPFDDVFWNKTAISLNCVINSSLLQILQLR
ncbi:hypothetical protein AWENTII_010283 [Aspergillus wentii]